MLASLLFFAPFAVILTSQSSDAVPPAYPCKPVRQHLVQEALTSAKADQDLIHGLVSACKLKAKQSNINSLVVRKASEKYFKAQSGSKEFVLGARRLRALVACAHEKYVKGLVWGDHYETDFYPDLDNYLSDEAKMCRTYLVNYGTKVKGEKLEASEKIKSGIKTIGRGVKGIGRKAKAMGRKLDMDSENTLESQKEFFENPFWLVRKLFKQGNYNKFFSGWFALALLGPDFAIWAPLQVIFISHLALRGLSWGSYYTIHGLNKGLNHVNRRVSKMIGESRRNKDNEKYRIYPIN